MVHNRVNYRYWRKSSYIKEKKLEDEIRPAPLEVLREFLIEDVEHVRPSHDWVYSENITFEVSASV